jgi:hypothetical protein
MNLYIDYITIIRMCLYVFNTIYHAAFITLETKLPNVLHGMLLSISLSKLSSTFSDMLPRTHPLHSMAHFQPAEWYTANCTRWHTLSICDYILSRGKIHLISLDYMLPCMLLHAQSRDLPSCIYQSLGSMKLV